MNDEEDFGKALKRTQWKLVGLRENRSLINPNVYKMKRKHHLVWCKVHRQWRDILQGEKIDPQIAALRLMQAAGTDTE